jgi:hypothetical protein
MAMIFSTTGPSVSTTSYSHTDGTTLAGLSNGGRGAQIYPQTKQRDDLTHFGSQSDKLLLTHTRQSTSLCLSFGADLLLRVVGGGLGSRGVSIMVLIRDPEFQFLGVALSLHLTTGAPLL